MAFKCLLVKATASDNTLAQQITCFFVDNAMYEDSLVKWDTFKSFLRGVFVSTINSFKTPMKQHEEQLAQQVRTLEQEYSSHPSDSAKTAWLSAQEALTHVIHAKAEKKRFFAKATFFEEGEQTGRLLAKVVNSRPAAPATGRLPPC